MLSATRDGNRCFQAQARRQDIGRLRQQYRRASRFLRTEFIEQDGGPALQVDIDEEKLAVAELLDGVCILKIRPARSVDRAAVAPVYDAPAR